jgi:outer membrane receptor protein involved in Fe transport
MRFYHLSALAVGLSVSLSAAGDYDPENIEIVVTATKTEHSIREIPAAASVVTREEIDNSSAVTVDQLLRTVPGVYAARMDPSSPSRIAQTYVRGLPGNSRTLVLLDGVPMNSLYDGQVDWSQLSTNNVERVEIVRGASSGLYGTNAMGGVINIISRAPEPGVHSRVSFDYGSLDSSRVSAEHTRSTDNTSFSVSATHFESDGYNMWRPEYPIPAQFRDSTGTVKDNFAVKVMRDVGSSGLLEANINYMKDEVTGFYKPGTDGYTPQTREQIIPSISYTSEGTDSITSFVLYGRFGEQKADTLDRFTYSTITQEGSYTDQSVGISLQQTRRLGSIHNITYGADYVDGKIDNDFTYPTDRRRNTRGDLEQYGAFIQDEIELSPRWIANISGRYDYWKTGGNQTDTGTGAGPSTDYVTRKDGFFSPKAGLLFKYSDQLHIRTTVGRAFNLPDMYNLYSTTTRGPRTYWGDPELDPEIITSVDAGVDYYFKQGGFFKITAYYNEAEDFIYSVERDPLNFDKTNIGGVVTKGVELEAQFMPTSQLTITGSMTYNDSLIVEHKANEDLVGNFLTHVPRKQASIRADWTPNNRSLVYAQVNYVGKRYGNDTNTTVYNEYLIADVGGKYRFNDNVTARLTWSNVTDDKYDGIGYIAPGSTLMAGVDLQF